jgi:hypothetical protein
MRSEIITAVLRTVPGLLARTVRIVVLLAAFAVLAPAALAHPGGGHHRDQGQPHHPPAIAAAVASSPSPGTAVSSPADFRPAPATYLERVRGLGEPCDDPSGGNHHSKHPGCCGTSVAACATACAAGAMAVLPSLPDVASAWVRAAMPACAPSPAGAGIRPAERPPRFSVV